jgi:hypothetical protein
MSRVTLNGSRAGRAAQRSATSITRNEMQSLGGVIRVRTRLSHAPSPMLNYRKLSDEKLQLQKVTV